MDSMVWKRLGWSSLALFAGAALMYILDSWRRQSKLKLRETKEPGKEVPSTVETSKSYAKKHQPQNVMDETTGKVDLEPCEGDDHEQESQEVGSAYYVDLASDEEEGATVEAQVHSLLKDLEILFQEQLAALVEDAMEQQAVKKGKAVVRDPSQQEDHPSIMVLEEESATTPTRPVELITLQPGGGFRWFVQHMPRSRSAEGGNK